MKKYRYIWIPALLLIYLGAMAWYTYPGRENTTLGYTQYYITIGITLVIIAGVSYFFKKRDRKK